jgi:transcriptional regulator with XRE-family HTH domain
MATKMVTNQELGQRLRKHRGERGLTEVAAQIGISVDTLRRFESGIGIRGPGYLEIVKAAEYFGVSVESFAAPEQVA